MSKDTEQDARFEDAPFTDRPLRLKAESADDLAVIASLVQDGVARAGDIAFMRRKRRFVIVLNRFRWEDAEAAKREGRPFERVRSVLAVESITNLRARGLKQGASDTVIALLSLAFEPGEDGAGRLTVTCAENIAFAADVECLDVTVADLTRPWEAQARQQPAHGD